MNSYGETDFGAPVLNVLYSKLVDLYTVQVIRVLVNRWFLQHWHMPGETKDSLTPGSTGKTRQLIGQARGEDFPTQISCLRVIDALRWRQSVPGATAAPQLQALCGLRTDDEVKTLYTPVRELMFSAVTITFSFVKARFFSRR